MNPIAATDLHYNAPDHADDPSSTQSSQRQSKSQKLRNNNVHGRKAYLAKAVTTSPTLPNDSKGAILLDDKVMLDATALHDPSDSTAPIAYLQHAGDKATPFNTQMHERARAYLMQICPQSSSSIEYVTVNTKLTEAYGELDWVLNELRDVEEAQFSLANLRLRRTAMALPEGDPEREVLMQALDSNDKALTMTRHRLQTRERHTRNNLETLKNTLKNIEQMQLAAWETMMR